jgi:dsRNA-specific ribonuclease
MTGWRDRLEGELALDVQHLDRALGLQLHERVYVEALVDPRGHLFQRLEYVGDAILDSVVLQELVLLEPWSESDLSVVSGGQQSLVSDHALGRVAARRGLPDVRTFDASRHRLADRIEASIGAAWADTGIVAAEAVARHLVVGPGLRHLQRRAGVPEADGDEGYESAARSCGHEPVTAAWYGAAARAGAPRRRLAVVGNAVLEAAFSTAQYVESPWASEAEMSEERRTATSNAVLAERAHDLGLRDRGDPTDRRSVADGLQALVGAAAMDGGLVAGLGVAAGVLRRSFVPGPVELVL